LGGQGLSGLLLGSVGGAAGKKGASKVALFCRAAPAPPPLRGSHVNPCRRVRLEWSFDSKGEFFGEGRERGIKRVEAGRFFKGTHSGLGICGRYRFFKGTHSGVYVDYQ